MDKDSTRKGMFMFVFCSYPIIMIDRLSFPKYSFILVIIIAFLTMIHGIGHQQTLLPLSRANVMTVFHVFQLLSTSFCPTLLQVPLEKRSSMNLQAFWHEGISLIIY